MPSYKTTKVQELTSSLIYADQYPTLQAAINALPLTGGTVILPAKSFTIYDPVYIGSNTTIQGMGYGSVVRSGKPDIGMFVVKEQSRVAFTNFRLEGSGGSTNAAFAGITIQQSDYVFLDSLILANFLGRGVRALTVEGLPGTDVDCPPGCEPSLTNFISSCTHVHIQNNSFLNVNAAILCRRGVINSVISNNVCNGFASGDGVGIELTASTDVKGLYHSTSQVTISGNTLVGFGSHGIMVACGSYNVISSNVITDVKKSGIACKLLESNDEYNNGTSSRVIPTVDCQQNTITGNTIVRSGLDGILISGSGGNTITGNSIEDSAYNATGTYDHVSIQHKDYTNVDSLTYKGASNNIVTGNTIRKLSTLSKACRAVYVDPTTNNDAALNYGNIITTNTIVGDQIISADQIQNIVEHNYPRTSSVDRPPDFDTLVFQVDNQNGAQNDYFLARQFEHNLNTRDLETEIQLSITEPLAAPESGSDDPCAPPPPGGVFQGIVWSVNSGNGGNSADSTFDLQNDFRVVFPDENVMNFYIKAHASVDSKGVTSDKRYIFHDFDPDNPEALVVSGKPNYVDRGIAVKKAWFRIVLRKTSVS